MIKNRWAILMCAPHYDMGVQAKIPAALVALHNFIMEHDAADLDRWIVDEAAEDLLRGRRRGEIDFGQLATATKVTTAEKRRAEHLRDKLAQDMWEDYQRILAERQDQDDTMDIDGVGNAMDVD